MVQISDSPPTGKVITVSGSRFGTYRRGSQNPSAQSTRQAAEYKANAHFYISYCDIIDGVPLYENPSRLPPNPSNNSSLREGIPQVENTHLLWTEADVLRASFLYFTHRCGRGTEVFALLQ